MISATGTPSWETEPERGALYDLTAPSSRAQLVPDGEGTVSLVRLEGMRTDPSGDPLPLAHEIATWNRPTLWAQFPDLRRAAGAVRFEVAQDRVMAGKAKREEVRWGDFRPPGVVDEDVVGAVWSYASGCSRALYLGLRTYLDEMGARDQSVPGALARRWWRAAEPHLMAVVGTGAAPDVADTEIRALRRAMVALYDSEAGASGSRQLRAAALGRDRLRSQPERGHEPPHLQPLRPPPQPRHGMTPHLDRFIRLRLNGTAPRWQRALWACGRALDYTLAAFRSTRRALRIR